MRMLFELAKESFSHYPLGGHDYTKIDFSCNIKKNECEVLREETELKGDVHPIQCLMNAWEKVMRPFGCSSNCGCYLAWRTMLNH